MNRREALLFEAGIKLGGIFHQYLGTPVAPSTSATLARSIEAAVGLQPFVERVKVRIAPSKGGRLGVGRFRYRYLTAEMLSASVTLVDGSCRVEATLTPRADLRYPLMRVEEIVEPARVTTSTRSGRTAGRRRRRTGSSAGSA